MCVRYSEPDALLSGDKKSVAVAQFLGSDHSASEAAHRTPPGKHTGGAEVNHKLFEELFLLNKIKNGNYAKFLFDFRKEETS